MFRDTVTRRVLTAGCAALAGVGALVIGGGAADAAGTMTITSINVHRLPALTDKQQIVITGTNFDEDSIDAVNIAGCTAGSYFVSSATTLVFKTDATCAIAASAVITIDPVSGSNVVTTPVSKPAQALAFVAAPTLAANDGTTFPVTTSGTAAQTTPTFTASTTGGTGIRVTAGATKFVNSTTYPLAATLNGVKLSSIVMKTGGDWFTATLPAVAASAAPVLRVTSNGVSKSFAYAAASSSSTVADSFEFTIAGVGITASPASGPMDGGNTLTVKGAGFTAATTATVGGTSCPKTGTTTATSFTCTVPAATTEGPVSVVMTTGSVTSVVSAGSTYTYVP